MIAFPGVSGDLHRSEDKLAPRRSGHFDQSLDLRIILSRQRREAAGVEDHLDHFAVEFERQGAGRGKLNVIGEGTRRLHGDLCRGRERLSGGFHHLHLSNSGSAEAELVPVIRDALRGGN